MTAWASRRYTTSSIAEASVINQCGDRAFQHRSVTHHVGRPQVGADRQRTVSLQPTSMLDQHIIEEDHLSGTASHTATVWTAT